VPITVRAFNYIFKRIIIYKNIYNLRIIIIFINIWFYTLSANFDIKNNYFILFFIISGLITVNYKIRKKN